MNNAKLLQQERSIQQVTDLICRVMREQSITKAQLARKLGKTKGYVTQLLDGQTNMTVRTISDVLLALGRVLHVEDAPVDIVLSQEMQLDWSDKKLKPTVEESTDLATQTAAPCAERMAA